MKKRMMFLLLAVLLVALAACGKQTKESTEATTVPAETAAKMTEATEATETLPEGVIENPFESDSAQTEATEETKAKEENDRQEEGGPVDPDIADEPEDKPAATKPVETTPRETTPEPSTEPEKEEKPGKEKSEYEKFMDMNAQEQNDFMNSFDTIDAFFEWYNAEKEKYENSRNEIEVDGSINIGDIISGKK